MKKAIIIILLSVLICSNADSQTNIGFRSSFNLSSLSTGSAMNRPGFSIGAMLSQEISDGWYFQPAIVYSFESNKPVKGFKPAYSASAYNLEVPLMLSRRMGDEDISFGVDFGAFAKYGLYGKYWVDDLTTKERTKPDLFDHKNRFDVGPQAGFSIMVYNLYIAYSFQFGLIKPWDDRRGNSYNSSVTFGYLFSIY